MAASAGMSVSSEDAAKRRENACFPVNQGAVAVELMVVKVEKSISQGVTQGRRMKRDAARRVSTQIYFSSRLFQFQGASSLKLTADSAGRLRPCCR